ncbi:MAG: hypothetical protein JNL72_11440 [Flavipsychrobacter sp.]|nr:hypothetical protein [Flavipsychrobacter sp.]
MRKIFPLRLFFFIGVAIFFVGALFRIQHWPYGSTIVWIGLLFEVVFFLLVFVEMLMSKKASSGTKLIWMVTYLICLSASWWFISTLSMLAWVVLGLVYLRIGRAKFLFTRSKLEQIQFDSI